MRGELTDGVCIHFNVESGRHLASSNVAIPMQISGKLLSNIIHKKTTVKVGDWESVSIGGRFLQKYNALSTGTLLIKKHIIP